MPIPRPSTEPGRQHHPREIVHPTHWLISTQARALARVAGGRRLIVSLSFAARGGGATERAAQIRVLEGQTGGYYELVGA